ncbi:MAG: low molecular weight protein arginine phosphatase [Ruminococcaceae bacterium]|nr:low molecular weight protein arginine phosphatase [Oscillospiraceae bacterium]
MNTVLEPETLQAKTEEKKTGKKILFVCTGNTCRSPMAAALYNAQYGTDGSHAFSAGLAADGSGISRNAVLALLGAGIRSGEGNDYLSHVSHTVTEEDLQKADLVVGITGRHAMQLMFAAPAFASRITSLPVDIGDPYGGDEQVYADCLAQIAEALAQMFASSEKEDDRHA